MPNTDTESYSPDTFIFSHINSEEESTQSNKPSAEPLTSEKRLQLAWQNFVALEYQIQVADRKVQAIMGANAFLAAAVTFQGGGSLSLPTHNAQDWFVIITMIARVVLLGCIAATAIGAILALMPRLIVSSKSAGKTVPVGPPSPFFFGDVSVMGAQRLQQIFFTMNTEEATRYILSQVYPVSSVLSTKYKFLRYCATTLMVAVFLWLTIIMAYVVHSMIMAPNP